MQRHTHGTLAHRELRGGRLDRSALYGDRLQHIALTPWQALQMRDHFAGRNSLCDGLADDGFREIVDIDEDASAAAAQRIDQLVTRDCKQPWRKRSVCVPGMSLQMYCEQNILHDILGLIDGLPGSRQTPPRHCPQDRCY